MVYIGPQVMACCRQAITWTNVDLSSMVLWHLHENIYTGNSHDIILNDECENYILEITGTS